MAVANQTPYKEYIGNGTTKIFPLEFDCDDADHLIVKVNDIEVPALNNWSLNTNTGSVVFAIAPISQSKIILQRDTPLVRDTDYQTYNNSFKPQPVNNDFDRIWLKLQELGVTNWLTDTDIKNLSAYVNSLNDETRDEFYNNLGNLEKNTKAMLDEAIKNGAVSALAITTVNTVEELEDLNAWEGRTVSVTSIGNYKYNSSAGQWQRDFITDRQVVTVSSIAELLTLPVWDGRVASYKNESFKFDFSKRNQNDGGVIIDGWVRQAYAGVADPVWFGADKNGATDVTPVLNNMILNGYKNIHFKTSGNYLISSELNEIDSDVTINFGKTEDVKILFGANIVWCNPKKKNNITFYNINIVDILKTSADAFSPLLIHGLNCTNLHVYDVKSEDCAIVLTNAFNGTGQATYNEANVDINSVNFNGCQNVKVHDIVAVDTLKEKRVIVNIGFTLDFVINNIDAKNSIFPAMFWGGDSNTNINGSASNERKVKRGIISKIKGYDCTALAWGSMGEKILITECIGENFSDVGVDFEGCLNCIATNNFVKNAKNGNFTTFFLNRKVRFSNNISELTGSLRHHYLSYNMSQSDLDIDGVVFSDNLLTSFDTVGLISDYSGTIGNINILNNSLKNVCIDVSTLNANGCAIKNNNLFFSMALAQSPIKISTKNSFGIIDANLINSSLNQSVSTVTLRHSDFNFGGRYQVSNNTVRGSFNFALSIYSVSENAGIGMDVYVHGNKFTSNKIESQNPERVYIKQWFENKNDIVNFPNSNDTTQYMWKNMIARPDDFNVGQPQGWVCTSSGSPATWIAMSNL